jgi:type II secretory ATPase GspE/PulE/Tfp pilus assembly ATPase PilB-like protein
MLVPNLSEILKIQDTERLVRELINLVLLQSVVDRAIEIHFDPLPEGKALLRYRLDGLLYEFMPPPAGTLVLIIQRLKTMASLNREEQFLPQDGQVLIQVNNRPIDLRISIIPTFHGERAVVRILDRAAELLRLDQLGLNDDLHRQVLALAQRSSGLVIASGPAGSGKTTLLYNLLQQRDLRTVCTMTVEDPVELALPGIAQVQVRPEAGVTLARAFRAALRQSPNVIMLAEIRDLETAELAIQAALTGHLVFTTLHASTAAGAIRRLMDLGVADYRLKAALAGVIAMRLMRTLCPQCRRRIEPPTHLMPSAEAQLVVTPDAAFYQATGCDACSQSGFRGRTGLYEVLTVNDAIRDAIRAGADPAAVRAAAIADGMKPLLRHALEQAARGVTSVEEVLRVVPAPTEL